MRKNERSCDEIPDNDNADAQYTALLLREEELIEAVRMVDPEEASKMESKLDKITRVPWSKLEQSDQTSDEIRLDRLHSIERARNEAEEAIQKEIQQAALKKAHEEKIRQQETRLALQQDQKVLSDQELTQAILAFISKRSRPKRCPDNGEYSWSGKVFHVKQQIKWK
ncbi:hypothetical protein D6D27_00272 [Aureobasidium pullulans]|nr:hypothetical protein D6D27_00272 [Aureobasidium pullulans]